MLFDIIQELSTLDANHKATWNDRYTHTKKHRRKDCYDLFRTTLRISTLWRAQVATNVYHLTLPICVHFFKEWVVQCFFFFFSLSGRVVCLSESVISSDVIERRTGFRCPLRWKKTNEYDLTHTRNRAHTQTEEEHTHKKKSRLTGPRCWTYKRRPICQSLSRLTDALVLTLFA